MVLAHADGHTIGLMNASCPIDWINFDNLISGLSNLSLPIVVKAAAKYKKFIFKSNR